MVARRRDDGSALSPLGYSADGSNAVYEVRRRGDTGEGTRGPLAHIAIGAGSALTLRTIAGGSGFQAPGGVFDVVVIR